MDDDSEKADNIDGGDDDLEPGSQSVLPFNFSWTLSILSDPVAFIINTRCS